MIARVLVPLDGTRRAERALGPAAGLAHQCAAPMSLVFRDAAATSVAWLNTLLTWGCAVDAYFAPDPVNWVAEEERWAQSYLDGWAAVLRSHGLSVTTVISNGLTTDDILREAHRTPGTVIVAVARRRGWLWRLLGRATLTEALERTGLPIILVPDRTPHEPSDLPAWDADTAIDFAEGARTRPRRTADPEAAGAPRASAYQEDGALPLASARCVLCHSPTVLDDVAIPCRAGRCFCLRCFARETGSRRRMPRALRRQLSGVLNAGRNG